MSVGSAPVTSLKATWGVAVSGTSAGVVVAAVVSVVELATVPVVSVGLVVSVVVSVATSGGAIGAVSVSTPGVVLRLVGFCVPHSSQRTKSAKELICEHESQNPIGLPSGLSFASASAAG